MKTMKHITLVAALTIAAASYAQESSTTTNYTPPSRPTLGDNPGLLGTSYTDIGANWEDIKHDANDAYSGAIRANVPLATGFDAGLGYNYWRHDDTARFSSHVAAADGKFYFPAHGVKPFAGGQVGYQWARADFRPGVVTDHRWIWGANAGHGDPGANAGFGGVQGVHSGSGGDQVAVEQAGQSGAAFGWWVFVGGSAGGVGADQVVEDVPARCARLQQMIVVQVVQPGLGGVQVGVDQGCGGVRVEVLAGVQGEQAQQPPLPGG